MTAISRELPRFYSKGGYSKPYATLHVDPLETTIMDGFKLEVIDPDNHSSKSIRGKALGTSAIGMTIVKFQYDEDFANQCNVGGLPPRNLALESCLPSWGKLKVMGQSDREYAYNPLTENNNDRTLAGLSTGAQSKLHDCGGSCPYPMYQVYNNYYGNFQYGHEFVSAAARGGSTERLANGIMDFTHYNEIARAGKCIIGLAWSQSSHLYCFLTTFFSTFFSLVLPH